MNKFDDHFFDRADEHIQLSNKQLSKVSRGKVSASMMFSVARFNAWVSACDFKNGADMKAAKQDLIKYFVAEYEQMLEENLDDYIESFDNYMKV